MNKNQINQYVTGMILAGGAGQRLGGVDKGLYIYRGKPLIEWVFNDLRSQLEHICISANRNIQKYQHYCTEVIPDFHEQYLGPLAGIQAGLHHIKTPYLLCVPCDCPHLPTDLVSRLFTKIQNTDADWVHARVRNEDDSRDHPTFLICNKRITEKVDETINARKLKLMTFLSELSIDTVDYESESFFANLNLPQHFD